MADTVRITVTLRKEKVSALAAEADKKGLPLPTFCRILLSETADNYTENRG